jgi:hypothetical protein
MSAMLFELTSSNSFMTITFLFCTQWFTCLKTGIQYLQCVSVKVLPRNPTLQRQNESCEVFTLLRPCGLSNPAADLRHVHFNVTISISSSAIAHVSECNVLLEKLNDFPKGDNSHCSQFCNQIGPSNNEHSFHSTHTGADIQLVATSYQPIIIDKLIPAPKYPNASNTPSKRGSLRWYNMNPA